MRPHPIHSCLHLYFYLKIGFLISCSRTLKREILQYTNKLYGTGTSVFFKVRTKTVWKFESKYLFYFWKKKKDSCMNFCPIKFYLWHVGNCRWLGKQKYPRCWFDLPWGSGHYVKDGFYLPLKVRGNWRSWRSLPFSLSHFHYSLIISMELYTSTFSNL